MHPYCCENGMRETYLLLGQIICPFCGKNLLVKQHEIKGKKKDVLIDENQNKNK